MSLVFKLFNDDDDGVCMHVCMHVQACVPRCMYGGQTATLESVLSFYVCFRGHTWVTGREQQAPSPAESRHYPPFPSFYAIVSFTVVV